jgi:DNA-binding NarL/FixJ family response regulator
LSLRLIELVASSAFLVPAFAGYDRKPRSKPAAAAAPGGPRILLVESHSLIGSAVGGLIGGPPLGAQVETVADITYALERLDAEEFDLVVCGLSNPPAKATELVAGLTGRGATPPIVFLADAGEEHFLLDSLSSGATGFFTMDVAPRELIAGLKSVMKGRYTVGSKLKRMAQERTGAEGTAPDR